MNGAWIITRKRKRGTTYQVRYWDGDSERVAKSFGDKIQARDFVPAWIAFRQGKGPDPRQIGPGMGDPSLVLPAIRQSGWRSAVRAFCDGLGVTERTTDGYRQKLMTIGDLGQFTSVSDCTLDRLSDILRSKVESKQDAWSLTNASNYARVVLQFLRDCDADLPPKAMKRFRRQWRPYAAHKRAGVHIYTEAEIERMLAACEDMGTYQNPLTGENQCRRSSLWWKLFILLPFDTGMRFQEFTRLRWADIDYSKRISRVCAHQEGQPDGVWSWKPKSTAGARLLPISERLFDLLSAHRQTVGDCPYVMVDRAYWLALMARGGPARSTDYLVAGHWTGFLRIKKAAGIGRGTIHDLRHSRLTHWALSGLPVKALQRLAGHERVETTLNYYAHVDDLSAVAMAKALDKSQALPPA